MTMRRFVPMLLFCCLIALLTAHALSQTRGSRSGLDREQRLKEFHERVAKRKKEFLREKYALGATEEQWKVIKAKLEKVRQLRYQARSTVGMGLTSSSSSGTSSRNSASRSVPT